MLKVVGSSDGRIFCAGRDGCIHEVVYDSIHSNAIAPPPTAPPGTTTGSSLLSGGMGLVEGVIKAGTWVTDALGVPMPAMKRAKRINQSTTTAGYVVATRAVLIPLLQPCHCRVACPAHSQLHPQNADPLALHIHALSAGGCGRGSRQAPALHTGQRRLHPSASARTTCTHHLLCQPLPRIPYHTLPAPSPS